MAIILISILVALTAYFSYRAGFKHAKRNQEWVDKVQKRERELHGSAVCEEYVGWGGQDDKK